MANNSGLLTRKQAAAHLQSLGCSIAENTLKNMANKNSQHKGPPYFKDGGRTLYNQNELDEWRRNRLVRVE